MSGLSSLERRITPRIPGDEALRLRDEKLERMKSVIAKLLHDFNNFWAPQFGYVSLLRDEVATGSTAASYVEAMESSAEKWKGYIAKVYLGIRPQHQFVPREFSFDHALRDIFDKWAAESAGSQLRLECHVEPFQCFGDEAQWREVFGQLLSNGRYALAVGGELEVSLRPQRLTGQEIQRLGLALDDVFCLRIRDSGFGMNAEIAERAFEPFFSTRTQIKAPGLGLLVVHSVTQWHGGQVELHSSEDEGTTVTLWIPRASPHQNRTGLGFGAATSPRKKRVLLIEDDPLIKEVLRSWLAASHLDCESVGNESQARQWLERLGSECVLIISETDLQSGRGEALHANLRDFKSGIPWVFLMSQRTPQFAPGRQEPLIMKKPFSRRAFADVIRKYMGG